VHTRPGRGILVTVGAPPFTGRRGRGRLRARSGPFRTSFTLPPPLPPTLLPFLPLVPALVSAPVVAHVMLLPRSVPLLSCLLTLPGGVDA
jgi:hypothetical protein